jgi:hypothetical protein
MKMQQVLDRWNTRRSTTVPPATGEFVGLANSCTINRAQTLGKGKRLERVAIIHYQFQEKTYQLASFKLATEMR